jgi:hypothetical protein
MIFFPFGISNVLCKVSLISLIDFTDGGCITDIDNGITIINIDTNKTETRINTSQRCSGITYHHGVLLWCEVKRGIQMMKLSDDRITTLITDIICACLAFIVLITTDGELVSIETDPNDVIVDIISFIFLSMLHFRLSCCKHPSSDKAIMYFSSF